MPIKAGDIKLIASQTMDDVPEGGGAPTSLAIVDNTSNSMFNDISELDRAGGRINLRKTFLSIQTDTVDGYYGANVIVADEPDDPRVAVTLFSTNDVFDTRDAARNRIEAYLAPGPEWPAYLFENHIRGQRSIQFFQRPTEDAPPIGHTLMLVWHEGLADQRVQYVRVTKTASVIRTFTYDMDKDYEAKIVTCDLSDQLLHDFPGSPASRYFTRVSTATMTRDTVVADAATYHGVVRLEEPIALGHLSAKCETIFTQLVPSAQTEIPIIDVNAAGEYDTPVDAANGLMTIPTNFWSNPNLVLTVSNPIFAGTLTVTVDGGVLVDAGGHLMADAAVVGLVDYNRGLISFASSAPSYHVVSVSFRPAGAPLHVADSASIQVSQETRSYNYPLTIIPPPAPGTTRVSYRSNGNWYDLKDNGTGQLVGGDVSIGSGTVSYVTGTVNATLGALPDVGSSILYAWGATPNYINRSNMAVPPVKIVLQLSSFGVAPGTVRIEWNDGSVRVATDDGKGNITGSATGKITYTSGIIELTPANLPAGGQTYTVSYSYGDADAESFPAPLRNGNGTVTITLDKQNLTPGTLEVRWNLLIENYEAISLVPAELQIRNQTDPYKDIYDDGVGNLRDANGVAFGTIDYAAGKFTFTPDATVSIPDARYDVIRLGDVAGTNGQSWAALGSSGGTATNSNPAIPIYRNVFRGFDYIPAGATMPVDDTALVTVKYRATTSNTVVTEDLTPGNPRADITSNYNESIVPGSINFVFGGKTYFDRLGSLYYDLQVNTGAATRAGTINYQTGQVEFIGWVPGAANSLAMRSLLTTLDGQPVDEITFRVPVAPVRPGSLQLTATRLDGGLVNVRADISGAITGTKVLGAMDYESGVGRIRFGQWETAAGQEHAVWFDPVAVDSAGKIFHPYPVFANTIKFNAVAYTYLPLDANILGLDPVRLPQDGRVPIFRKGGFVVIGHTGTVGPITVSNGQEIDCGRVRLSRVRVIGADDVVINTGYITNLEAGTVTFDDVSTYVQPVRVEHRIEDMVQVSDVQINGQLGFTRQVTHDYPVGSYVSSALIAGDLHARTSIVFDQQTWKNLWEDNVQGDAALGTYDTARYPIKVTNAGALTERWAVHFQSATTFNLIGQHVGVIAIGDTSTPLAPKNPATNTPYFTIDPGGWGLGWATGNVLRFNTVGAFFPIWAIRTIQQGPETEDDDSFTMLLRGDVDKP